METKIPESDTWGGGLLYVIIMEMVLWKIFTLFLCLFLLNIWVIICHYLSNTSKMNGSSVTKLFFSPEYFIILIEKSFIIIQIQ